MPMKPKRKEKKIIQIFSSKVSLFLLIVVLAGIGKISFDKFLEVEKARTTISEEEGKIEEIKQKSEKLREDLEYLQSKEYLENIAKEKLNLVRPGEKIIYVLPEKKEEAIGEKPSENKGFWEKLKEIFIRE